MSAPPCKEPGNPFKFALRGLAVLLRTQRHARIHLAATLLAVVAGIYFDITAFEWCSIVSAIALVWVAEALNTALEFLADAAVPQRHELICRAKDVAAGAVLIAAATAVVVGLFIFTPAVVDEWETWRARIATRENGVPR